GDRHVAVAAQGFEQVRALGVQRRIGLGPSGTAQGPPPSRPVIQSVIRADSAFPKIVQGGGKLSQGGGLVQIPVNERVNACNSHSVQSSLKASRLEATDG